MPFVWIIGGLLVKLTPEHVRSLGIAGGRTRYAPRRKADVPTAAGWTEHGDAASTGSAPLITMSNLQISGRCRNISCT